MARRTFLVAVIVSIGSAAAVPAVAVGLERLDRSATADAAASRLLNATQVGSTIPPSPPPTAPPPTTQPSRCDPSYPTVCIPSPPPDLDCPDLEVSDFLVVGDDPHRFDGDDDGIGCESR